VNKFIYTGLYNKPF